MGACTVSVWQGGADRLDLRRLGAFALALVLSLASTVPIVYLCRLPECGKALLR